MPPAKTLEGRVAARKRPGAPLFRMDVAALVAVIAVLVFILVSLHTQVLDGRRFAVDLATSSQAAPLPGALREDAMLVSVTRDGAIYFRQREVRVADIADEIRSAVKQGSEKRVYLSADAHAKNQDVRAVIDEIRKAGVENVSVITNAPVPTKNKD